MIDTHCHLSHPEFEADREQVIEACWAGGVSGILEVGFSVDTSRMAIALARANPGKIRATVGIHPHESGRATDEDWAVIQELSRKPEVVAIGETGLDFYRDWAPRENQFEWFRRQIRFGVENNLPIIVHDRDAHTEVLQTIREEGRGLARGIFHCFSGDIEVAQDAIDLGFYLGLGGSITYWNPRKKGRMLKELPIERMLLETDAPWLTPKPEKGERNDPTRMTHVVARLAEIREMDPAAVIAQTTANTARLFEEVEGWPPRAS